MSLRFSLYKLWVGRHRVKISTTKSIALVFMAIILIGASLLTLPMASRSGQSCGFFPALFTSTSATCVTGLILFDTWSQWSGFGQIVILCLIEIGGLGFMSAASLVMFVLRRKAGLRQRMVTAQALSLNELDGAMRLQKWVLIGSLIVQTTGALILTLRFLPTYGLKQSVIWGVFHAVSAFCNAGFDILGSIEPNQSVMVFNNDPVICITLMALIVVGGLGFCVWEEIMSRHSFKKFSVYSKIVIVATAVLVVSGAVMIMLLEWNNPGTLQDMSVSQKVLNAFFQSVTTRTAGFASIDQAQLTDAGKAVSIVLMLIGGSSGSTAGGIKTVTFVVLLLFVMARSRGKGTVNVFRRGVPINKIMEAMTICSIMIGLSLVGSILICATSPVGFIDGLFEAVSALATVGLTANVTTNLSLIAQLVMIVFMYFGRVGVLTISLGFLMGDRAEERYQYAYTNLLIG